MALLRSRLVWLLFGLVLLGAGLTGWYLWPRGPRPPVLKLEGIDPRVVEALKKAQAAVEARPRSAQAWGDLGELLVASDLYAEGLVCLRQAERLEPTEVRWPYLQGFALLLYDPDAAVAPLTRATQVDPRAITPRLRLAETLLDRDDLDGAEKLFRAILDRSPDNARARLGLGLILQRRDNWADSVPQLEKAAGSPFARKTANAALAVSHLRLGDTVTAERHRREADDAPRDPGWPDTYRDSIQALRVSLPARIDHADGLLAQEQFEPAIQLLQEVLAEQPTSDEARLKLAQAYIRAGDPGAAKKELHKLVTDYPDLPDGHFLLGMVLLQWTKGSEADAEGEFRKAIELRPGFAMAHYNLGRCLQQQGKLGPARQAYEDALRHRPQLIIGHLSLARLLRDQGDRPAAREHLQQVLRLQPDEPEAKKLLAEEDRRPDGK
jgi:tetratricopeptide (TPR) repeat protein